MVVRAVSVQRTDDDFRGIADDHELSFESRALDVHDFEPLAALRSAVRRLHYDDLTGIGVFLLDCAAVLVGQLDKTVVRHGLIVRRGADRMQNRVHLRIGEIDMRQEFQRARLIGGQHEKPFCFSRRAVDQHAHNAQQENGKQQYGDQQDQQNASYDAENPAGCAAFTHGFILALNSNKDTKIVYTRKLSFDKFLNP